MALQAASVATAAYSTKNYDYIYNSLTGIAIDAEITSVRANIKCATFHLDMQLDGTTPKIKQSDDSLLAVDEIPEAFETKGYNVNVILNGLTFEVGVFWD